MSEHDIQTAIIHYLERSPKVAWCARFNSGAVVASYKGKKRFIRYNFLEGCPDIMGQLTDGRHLSTEVKEEGWTFTELSYSEAIAKKNKKAIKEHKQKDHLDLVNKNGGVGFFATSLDDVMEVI